MPDLGSIGPYELKEEIGQGTFGIVYRAIQREPLKREVAIKVLKDRLRTTEVLTRFELERQALAAMDHPAIVSIHDAGSTPDGKPYFVMELVDGSTLTEYCDRKKLPLEQRLELFHELCGAVQHAHHRGVVHRDLKPSNILIQTIGEKPVVKVIDFGIAKALGPNLGTAGQTEEGQVIGTRTYMSPEQASGEVRKVDTRTDIYSLGVVLYELISGSLPFTEEELRKEEGLAWRRLVIEVDPPRPSVRFRSTESHSFQRSTDIASARRETPRTLGRRLQDDLDWIAMCCLRKGRDQRYAAVSELAADVERFLHGQPVSVGPPTLRYRAGKLLRRHRSAVLAAAAVLLTALIGASAASILVARNIDQERQLAKQKLEELLEQAEIASRFAPDRATRILAQAEQLVPDDPRVGFLSALVDAVSGQPPRAIERLQRLINTHPNHGRSLALLAGLLSEQAPEQSAALRARAAEELNEADLLFAEALVTGEHVRAIELFTRSLARFDWNYHAVWQRGVRLFELERYEQALEDAELINRVAPQRVLSLTLRGAILAKLQDVANKRLPDDKQSLDGYQSALRDFDDATQLDPRSRVTRFNRCWVLTRLKDFQRALDDVRILEQESGLGWDQHEVIGVVYEGLGQLDRAEAAFTEAINLNSTSAALRKLRGDVRANQKQLANAREDYLIAERLGGSHPRIVAVLAQVELQLGNIEGAIAANRRGVEHTPTDASAHARLGRLLQRTGDSGAAGYHLRRAVDLDSDNPLWRFELGANHLLNDRLESARGELSKTLGKPGYTWVRVWLWDLLRRQGQRAAAERVLLAEPAEAPTPLYIRAAEALASDEPPQPLTGANHSADDQLYWNFTIGAWAWVHNDRARARQAYEAIRDLGNVRDTEVDLAVWRLAQLDRRN